MRRGSTLSFRARRTQREGRTHVFLRRVRGELLHGDGEGLLELRIAAGDDVGRRLLDVDVGRHALVLDDEALGGPDAEVRCGDVAAVHQGRETEDADEASPGTAADERSEL